MLWGRVLKQVTRGTSFAFIWGTWLKLGLIYPLWFLIAGSPATAAPANHDCFVGYHRFCTHCGRTEILQCWGSLFWGPALCLPKERWNCFLFSSSGQHPKMGRGLSDSWYLSLDAPLRHLELICFNSVLSAGESERT